jgi:hypothetical protein
MRAMLVVASAVASIGLVALTSWVFDMSFGRAVMLAPVIVVSAGAVVGLVVLWTRVALDPILRRRRGAGPPLLALAAALVTVTAAGCGGSSGPKIVTFDGPSVVPCDTKGERHVLSFKYETKNATAVDPEIDGHPIGAQAGYDPKSGTMRFPYVCPGPHELAISAVGKTGKTTAKTAKVEPED